MAGAVGCGARLRVTVYGTWAALALPITGKKSPAKFVPPAPPPFAKREDEGISPVFKLPVSARCRCASLTSCSVFLRPYSYGLCALVRVCVRSVHMDSQ